MAPQALKRHTNRSGMSLHFKFRTSETVVRVLFIRSVRLRMNQRHFERPWNLFSQKYNLIILTCI